MTQFAYSTLTLPEPLQQVHFWPVSDQKSLKLQVLSWFLLLASSSCKACAATAHTYLALS